jgi:hypothetical protein
MNPEEQIIEIVSVKRKGKKSKSLLEIVEEKNYIEEDTYTEDICKRRWNAFKQSTLELQEIKLETNLPIRNQNPPEDITENTAKFIIRNYDNDPQCVWTKCLNKKHKLKGDLYSPKYDKEYPPEVKSFTSDGPSQFGPSKKFGVLYFLDMRNWLDNKIILWRVNLTSDSPEFKSIKMNKSQTHQDQCSEGRRPHISWEKLYPQIMEHCIKVYDGTFEGIFGLDVGTK